MESKAEEKCLKVGRSLYGSGKRKKRGERTLEQTEEQFRLLVDSLKEYAIFMMDVEGRILTWNSGAQRLKGYSADEVIGKHFSLFFTPDDVREGKPERILKEAASLGRCEEETWRVRKGGSRFWAKAITLGLWDQDGRLRGFGKVIRDMTSEKEAEEELRNANAILDSKITERTTQLEQINAALQAEIHERRRADEQLEGSLQQLRALSARIQVVREEERKRISREVHDGLGQSLTAIKMDLTWLKQKLAGGGEPVRKRTESALRLVDETIQTVRRVAAELRPGVLDDLGLVAAIEWETQEFQGRTGINCDLRMPEEDISLDTEHATAIFRIYQEILSNVVRHAMASQITVRLMKSAGTAILEVRDNGRGISEEQISNPKSLGLLGIRERTLLLDGHFAVHGKQGKGTVVVVQIPVEKPLPAGGA
jgi:PAS domain S-box-containing protein